MICLSKADEGTFRHLTYNQSPSPLAAENTTCQDMNGIANLREHVAAHQDDDSGGGLCHSSAPDEKWQHGEQPPGPWPPLSGTRWWSAGSISYLKAATGGEDQNCRKQVTSPSWLSRLVGVITWLLSVLVVSFLLNEWNSRGNNTSTSSTQSTTISPVGLAPVDVNALSALASRAPKDDPSVRSLRKRSTCTVGGVSPESYNLPLHVGALIIIWFVSSLACCFPILAKRFPGLRIPQTFFFLVRHFGTGVLIATAFVHLLPTAFLSLGNPCLGDFWTVKFPAMPGAISLGAIFLVTIIEMVFHPSRRCTSGIDDISGGIQLEQSAEEAHVEHPNPIRDMAPPRGRTGSLGHGLNRLQTREESVEEDEQDNPQSDIETNRKDGSSLVKVKTLSPEQRTRKERMQCVMLELGILFHSVFIGMALSVAIGDDFVVLLIAIAFHQTFEGLALGSRVAAVTWGNKKYQPWLMAAAYGLTTPLGQAIGIATHTLYSPDSETGLIVTGVMNAISAGLLTFASLVELMSEDFLSDDSWKILRGKKRVFACLLVFFGAFCMSLVGAWA